MDKEKEILRLIREIADDEEKLREAEDEANRSYMSDSSKQRYKTQADILTRSIARKLEVLKILKEA